MSMFSAMLFLHVLSSMALFATFALEGNILLRVRSAEGAKQLQASLVSFDQLRRVAIPAFIGVLLGGGYLAFLSSNEQMWVRSSLVATLLIMLVGGLVTGIRMARLKKLAATSQGFEALRRGAHDRAFVWSYGFRVGLTVGIVFLMTIRPELAVCLVALAGAALGGIIVATMSYAGK